jgi:hypothetical protein
VPQVGSAANRPLSGIGGATWLKITGLYGGAPKCPMRLQRPRLSTSTTNSSLSGIEESVAARTGRSGLPEISGRVFRIFLYFGFLTVEPVLVPEISGTRKFGFGFG